MCSKTGRVGSYINANGNESPSLAAYLLWITSISSALCVHNFFEGNKSKYTLTSVNAASRYNVTRPHETEKVSKVAFVLESIHKKGGVFKYPEILQCDDWSEVKSFVLKLLENYNVDIWRTTINLNTYTHTTLVEAFIKELAK